MGASTETVTGPPPVAELLAAAVSALGGSEREGQQQMAAAVERALRTGEHLAVQAGTGTGKSLAYLVPAVAHAQATGTPVVVATATLALQAQIVDRDMPRLAASLAGTLPRTAAGKVQYDELRRMVMKGRLDYARGAASR